MDTNKLNKLNIKKFIKGTSNPLRLQSLRLPRDLNLGGNKTQPKKVYKPNLNVVRNKNKLEKTKNIQKAKPKTFKEKSQLKDRFVQSTGIFSEGTGSKIETTKKTDKKNNLRDSKSSEKLESSYVVKHLIKTSQLNEAESNVKIDKSDSDSDEPKVPFVPSTWDEYQKILNIKKQTKAWSNYLPPEYTIKPDKANPIITLWQMPDSLCCKGKQPGDFHLQDMPEGQIGKVTVHKSGKFEVSIADSRLLLDSMLDSFSEQVVCINSDTKNGFVLGELTSRFVLSPDWSICL